MSETTLSSDWVKLQKEIRGKDLYIDKVCNPLKVGEPDIMAIYKCMPIFIEVKKINKISLINTHPFSDIQLRNLRVKKRAGAIAIGLLILDIRNVKYIEVNELQNHITKEQWLGANEFEWDIIRKEWLKSLYV